MVSSDLRQVSFLWSFYVFAWLAVYLAQPPLASKARLAGICMDYGNLGEGHLAADKAMLQRFCLRMP
jgi:hypothetical protein